MRRHVDDSSGKAQISIRLPADMLDAFGKIASALDRDRSWVVVRALRQYLDHEGADILEEAEGLAALDRGEGVDIDAVLAEADVIIAQAKARKAVKKAG
jgi:predicted transcriptional regulator